MVAELSLDPSAVCYTHSGTVDMLMHAFTRCPHRHVRHPLGTREAEVELEAETII